MSIQIVLDKPRELKFDIRATRDLEQALGKPIGSVISDLSSFSVTAMTMALWAGLKHEDRSLSQNLVMKLFEQYVTDKKSMRELIRLVSDALEETGLFEDEGGAEGNGHPGPTPTT